MHEKNYEKHHKIFIQKVLVINDFVENSWIAETTNDASLLSFYETVLQIVTYNMSPLGTLKISSCNSKLTTYKFLFFIRNNTMVTIFLNNICVN